MLKSFRRLFVIYKQFRGRLILTQILLLISALCMIGVATLNQQLINDGIEAQNPNVIFNTGTTMIALAIVVGITIAGTAGLAVFFSQGTAYIIRVELYNKIQTFLFNNFDQFRTGNLLVRLNSDVVNIQNAVTYMVVLLLYVPFMVLVAFILALPSAPSLAWILIVVSVVLGLMAILVPQVFKAYDERQHRLDAVNTTLQENLSGVRVVKAFVREKLEMERFTGKAQEMRKPAFAAAFRVAIFSPLLTGIAQILIAFTIGYGGSRC
jgi:ABC-type multidrug transport system fused ATPase/permease subunit